MKSLADYTVVVRPDDNGTFVAYVPAIVSCHALGETPEEARSELQNVFDMIAEEFLESGQSSTTTAPSAVSTDFLPPPKFP